MSWDKHVPPLEFLLRSWYWCGDMSVFFKRKRQAATTACLNVIFEVIRVIPIFNQATDRVSTPEVCRCVHISFRATACLTSVFFLSNRPSKIVCAFLDTSRVLRVPSIQYTLGLSTCYYMVARQQWVVDHYAVFYPFLPFPPIYTKIFFSAPSSSTPLVCIPVSGWRTKFETNKNNDLVRRFVF